MSDGDFDDDNVNDGTNVDDHEVSKEEVSKKARLVLMCGNCAHDERTDPESVPRCTPFQ
jgi:hypothetical protein